MTKEEIKAGHCYYIEFMTGSINNWVIYVTDFVNNSLKGWFMQIGLGGKWKEQTLGNKNDVTMVREATCEEIEQLIAHVKANGDTISIPLPNVCYEIY